MPRLTLSFDNGPDPDGTPHVLDELGRRGLRAVFFPVGERLLDPVAVALMQEATERGHRVGNHTFTHPRPLGALDGASAVAEIERTDELLGGLREPDRLFRPSAGGGVIGPGVLNRAVADHLVEHRHTLVMWNVVCDDWERDDGSWIELAAERMDGLDWALLVLHDVATGAMRHLGRFLDQVQAAGVEIVPELPLCQTPIVRGAIRGSFDHLLPA